MSIDNKTLKLPDYFLKTEESNNNKILSINSEAQKIFNADLTNVYNSLDLYQATGKTLDYYGEIYSQKRGNLTDEQYRIMILLKIARLTATCDFEGIINSLSMILNCDKSEIQIENSSNPAKIKIKNIPLTVLNKVGFNSQQAIEMLNALLPICVEIEGASFSGTFEFGTLETDYDELKGFGNIEQTIGGFFGLLIDDLKPSNLPK